MRRELLLQEIANIDKELNRVVAASPLPAMNGRPFPLGAWVFAGMCLGWAEYGHRIPGAYLHYLQTARYAWYLGIAMAVVALFSTISWLVRSFGRSNKSENYFSASREARILQERRRDLQAELRAISGE